MYDGMKDYIDKHNLLYSSQYGFRKDHLTQDAILDIVNAIQSNMNQGLFSCGVFIDINILLNKLNHYGFRGVIKDWFSSYLNNRTQIGPHISNKVVVFPKDLSLAHCFFYCMLMIYINARINLSFIFWQMILVFFMLTKT